MKFSPDSVYKYKENIIFFNGIQIMISPDSYFTKMVRVKKHHKRRIDKKWEKRYGYKNVPRSIQFYYVEPYHLFVCSKDYYEKHLKNILVV